LSWLKLASKAQTQWASSSLFLMFGLKIDQNHSFFIIIIINLNLNYKYSQHYTVYGLIIK